MPKHSLPVHAPKYVVPFLGSVYRQIRLTPSLVKHLGRFRFRQIPGNRKNMLIHLFSFFLNHTGLYLISPPGSYGLLIIKNKYKEFSS